MGQECLPPWARDRLQPYHFLIRFSASQKIRRALGRGRRISRNGRAPPGPRCARSPRGRVISAAPSKALERMAAGHALPRPAPPGRGQRHPSGPHMAKPGGCQNLHRGNRAIGENGNGVWTMCFVGPPVQNTRNGNGVWSPIAPKN